MNITKKIYLALFVAILLNTLFFMGTKNVNAVSILCADGQSVEASLKATENSVVCKSHGGISKTSTKSNTGSSSPSSSSSTTTSVDELDESVNNVINLLAALVGIIVVISIIIGGIQYSSAGGNSAQVGAAKKRISMSILALILYLFAYTILQWLIPGGIFS